MIYKLSWGEIDWNIYYVGGNRDYYKRRGEMYSKSIELLLKKCPITKKQGTIKIEEIKLIEEENVVDKYKE